MKLRLIVTLTATFFLTSCGEHSGYTVSEFSGDYRFYSGIGEFFDCNKKKKFYVANAGISTKLQETYLRLQIKPKEDVYIKIKGYLKEEVQKVEGIYPKLVFVPVKLISVDKDRGCTYPIREGE